MSTVKKIFALSLHSAGLNLSDRWYVRIKIPDFTKGCLVWKKCYGDVNKYKTVEERLAALSQLAAEITDQQNYTPTPGARKILQDKPPAFITSIIYQFNEQLEARSYRIRKSSRRRYVGLIKNLQAWLIQTKRPDMPLGSFTNADACAFLQWLIVEDHQSNESHNQHLRLFKSFYIELILKGSVKQNPFAGIKGMNKQNVPALYFSKDQIAILKSAIIQRDPQLWLFVNFIFYGFVRPGELRQLLISDLNFHEGRIRMRAEVSKNKKLQYVSIPAQLATLLTQQGINKYPKNYYVFGNKGIPGIVPLSVNAMKVRHQKICKDLNFSTEHKLYSWKHTGAIACARAGMPLKDLQMQLRHYSLDQVNRYLTNMLVWESDFIKNSYPSI